MSNIASTSLDVRTASKPRLPGGSVGSLPLLKENFEIKPGNYVCIVFGHVCPCTF